MRVDLARAAPRAAPRPGTPRAWAAWGWPFVAAAAGALLILQPVIGALALAGAVLLVLAFAAPRALVGLTVLVVLFVRPLEHVVPLPELGYVDEALVAVCAGVLPLRRVAARRRLRTFPGQWWFAGFVVAGLLSGLLLHVDPVTLGSGAFVVSKGLILAWAVAQVDWDERHLRTLARTGAVLVVLCLGATAANLVFPGPWTAVMASDFNAAESRGVLPSLIGPFSHPIDLGQFMTLSAIALTAWRMAVGKGPFTMALTAATAVGAVLSARRTAIGSLVAGWLWLKALGRSSGVWLAMAVCAPLAAVVLGAPIAAVVTTTYNDYLAPSAEPEARTVLTLDSFDVAAEHFPAGAGFGRFGSAVAASTYSPEYVERGYPGIWGLGRTAENGRFLTDTEWPAIIGESGLLGAAAFAVGLFVIHRVARRMWVSARSPLHRWIGLTAAGWTIACLVQSVATVTFTGPPLYGLFFGLVGVLAALSDDGRGDDRARPPSTS